MLIVCIASHYIIGLPLLNMLGPTISEALNSVFRIIPNPRYISSDHQTSFTSIEAFCKENDIMYIKSIPSAKNELGSVDSACRITTVFLQRITTSIDQTTRLSWPRYCKILFENLNGRHSNRSKFSRTENFFGPLRYLPNHRIFSSDTFNTANQMLDELKLSQQRKLIASEKKTQYPALVQMSFPRNSIVKNLLSKSEKPTIEGSKKLLPDNPGFFQVLRSGPTNIQVRSLSDGTIRTLRKANVRLVTFTENQKAVQLMRENFPKSLLWEFNSFHRKQSLPRYLYHSKQTINGKKMKQVKFSENSQIVCLDKLVELEEQFLNKYESYSLFPKFLKYNRVVHSTPILTKTNDSCFIFTHAIQNFLSCPCTSTKELNILYSS